MASKTRPAQRIDMAKVDKFVKDFARERNLPMDDPIVKYLMRQCKLSVGAVSYRNRIKAEHAARQTRLSLAGDPAAGNRKIK